MVALLSAVGGHALTMFAFLVFLPQAFMVYMRRRGRVSPFWLDWFRPDDVVVDCSPPTWVDALGNPASPLWVQLPLPSAVLGACDVVVPSRFLGGLVTCLASGSVFRLLALGAVCVPVLSLGAVWRPGLYSGGVVWRLGLYSGGAVASCPVLGRGLASGLVFFAW